MKHFINKKILASGFTTVELLIAVALVAVIGLAVSNFQENLFSDTEYLTRSFSAEGEARSILRKLISELRAMNYSGVGGYSIESATENSIVFYSDINGDGKTERLRYFLDGDRFRVGVVYPSGSPLSYDLNSEKIDTLVRNVSTGSNIFTYHSSEYNGENGSLPFPVDIPLIRLVKVDIPILIENRGTTTPYDISSHVSIRNLKENL